jgi:hypothetical protein
VSETPQDKPGWLKVAAGETVAPGFREKAFHCIHCHVLTSQSWTQTAVAVGAKLAPYHDMPVWRCTCSNCHQESWWLSLSPYKDRLPATMIYPRESPAPPPHPDTPEDVLAEYSEAADIVAVSPRGASALLRLALQRLMPHLGELGGNLNDDIGGLVAKGLPPGVQQALDSLRVIGNNAVHPGELDLTDDTATAIALFDLLNFIVEDRIARPAALALLYARLPEEAKQSIQRRDS